MAPRGTRAAAVCTEAKTPSRAARSRSRPARTPAAAAGARPSVHRPAHAADAGAGAHRHQCVQLKDWVLVRNGSRFWKDAVPALVCKVTKGLLEQDSTVSLVLPNLLALRHGFGSSRPFLELTGVSLRDVRPYVGADQVQLRATLLRAIRESRAGNLSKLTDGSAAAAPALPIAAVKGARVDAACCTDAVTTTAAREAQDEGIAVAAVVAPTPVEAGEPLEEDAEFGGVLLGPVEEQDDGMTSQEVGDAPLTPVVEQDGGMTSQEVDDMPPTPMEEQGGGAMAEEEGAPLTPTSSMDAESEESEVEAEHAVSAAASPHDPTLHMTPLRDAQRLLRPLQREESEQKDVQASAVLGAVATADKAHAVAGVSASAPAVAKPVDFLELTRAIARAFHTRGGATELSRQELEEDVGGMATPGELSKALHKLDEENKVFVSGDLVFLI